LTHFPGGLLFSLLSYNHSSVGRQAGNGSVRDSSFAHNNPPVVPFSFYTNRAPITKLSLDLMQMIVILFLTVTVSVTPWILGPCLGFQEVKLLLVQISSSFSPPVQESGRWPVLASMNSTFYVVYQELFSFGPIPKMLLRHSSFFHYFKIFKPAFNPNFFNKMYSSSFLSLLSF
jgi:hypothetical protein